MTYLELFWSFFQVGLFSFGGGYAALPLMQHQAVDVHGWITLTELSDMITISQMTPGPIAINLATFVGVRQGGILGAAVATFSCILPCSLIALSLAYFYFKYKNLNIIQGVLGGLRPAVAALVASAALSIVVLAFYGEGGFQASISAVDPVAAILFFLSFVALRRFQKLNAIWVILACGAVGGAAYLFL